MITKEFFATLADPKCKCKISEQLDRSLAALIQINPDCPLHTLVDFHVMIDSMRNKTLRARNWPCGST